MVRNLREAWNYSRRPIGPANGGAPNIRLIHITDPHLTTLDGLSLWSLRGKRWSGYLSWRRRRRFVHRADALERLTDAVQAEDAVQILVTGDLVHVGLPTEIDAAARWLETLGPPERVMLVPGNHDVYARDSWPAVARAWQPYLAGLGAVDGDTAFPLHRRLEGERGGISLVGLSSAVPSPLFMAWGCLGSEQRERLEEALGRAPGFRCVLVHHPPLPGMTHRHKGLLDAVELERVLHRHGAELIVHGHVHRNVSRLGPGGCRIFGTASASSASHHQAAYRRFDVSASDGGWRVEMKLVAVGPEGRDVVEEQTWDIVRGDSK